MVGQCPINATIFQERSLQTMCHLYPSCSGMPLVYHCVNYKDGLAEVCAPRDQITGSLLQNAVTKKEYICVYVYVCMYVCKCIHVCIGVSRMKMSFK